MKNTTYLIALCGALALTACNESRNSENTTLNHSKEDLSSIDPGHYDDSWWNRAPYRLVQTNLREIDATMDVDAYVQSMVDANANIVLINVGGIVANYPTSLPFQFRNTFMQGDLVGDLINGLHSKGIKVIGRFDFSKINETLAAKKPEWLYVSKDGKNVNYNGQVHTCVNGGYQQEYSMEILTEAITKYPFDGIFFNMIGYQTSDYSRNYYGICQSESCKKRFHDLTGHTLPTKQDINDPVYREYNEFKRKTANELFSQIESHIKTLVPEMMINSYADAGVDMIASESSSGIFHDDWNYSATDNVKRVLGSYKDRSSGNLLIYFQDIGYRLVGTSPNMAKVWMLENMLQGAPLGFVVIGTLLNYEDKIFIPTLNSLYGFHKSNEKLFTNIQSESKIALIKGSRDEYQGLIKLLSEEHIMYDIIEPEVIGTGRTPRKLEDYEALILGDVRNMNDDFLSIIDKYVKNGGKILTTGLTSTNDALGKSMNNIRLKSLGVEPLYEFYPESKSTYLKVSEEDKIAMGKNEFKDFSIMMVYSDFMKCKLTDNAIGYMRFLPEAMFGPPEKAYYLEKNITDFPGLISNEYGNGKSVFIPWNLGGQYKSKGNYMHRNLFVSALENLLEVERTLKTDASPLVEITHLANLNGAFEWFGMINHSGQIGGSYREPIPLHNTTIRFKPAKPIKKLILMNSKIELNFKMENDWVVSNVPEIGDFEMLLCLYDEEK